MVAVLRLGERNRLAQQIIDKYVQRHVAMDVGIGLIGIIPGAGVIALVTAMGLQAPFIYQPLARKLAQVYLAPPEALENVLDDVIFQELALTGAFDIAADFTVEFIKKAALEMVTAVGAGALLAASIPLVGGFFAAGLDYVIAEKMTNRVGRMIAIYYQNGGNWVGSQQETYELAKNMGDEENLDDIRKQKTVQASLLRNVKMFVEMMRHGMNTDQIREALCKQGIPDDLIDEALK